MAADCHKCVGVRMYFMCEERKSKTARLNKKVHQGKNQENGIVCVCANAKCNVPACVYMCM